MFRINRQPAPYWIDMPFAVRLEVEPPTTLLLDSVRDTLFDKASPAAEDEDEGAEDTEPAAKADKRTISMTDWALAMAPLAIRNWEGVGDETGKPLDKPDAEYIAAMLTNSDAMMQAFIRKYVVPALAIGEEGNG